MPTDISKIWVYRMIHYQNLDYILQNGIYYRNSTNFDPNYVNIGSTQIVTHRDKVQVKCYPGTIVNAYVPFYFGTRTPMLYKIKTGNGVPRRPQDEIIYLACNFKEISESGLQWCFTDGNAARTITEFYNSIDDLDKLDFHSIQSTEWTDNNSDGDHDRMRKKHSEFLVKDHVPVELIRWVIVLTNEKKQYTEALTQQYRLNIRVYIDDNFKFYYP